MVDRRKIGYIGNKIKHGSVGSPNGNLFSLRHILKGESMRIGSGYDVHKLAEGRDCIIGGVKIPYERDS